MANSICLHFVRELLRIFRALLGGSNRTRSPRSLLERMLGWFLFLLPIELIAALFLLFSRKYGRLGFNLTILNLLLYEGFFVVDVFVGKAIPIDKSDWLMMGLWTVFFAAVLVSARFILVGSRPVGKPVTQPSIETIPLSG